MELGLLSILAILAILAMSQITSDFRHAIRTLWKHRGFTVLVTLALGIGIGANASIYSLADVLLYRPLQLPDLDRAVQIAGTLRDGSSLGQNISPADLRDFQRDSKTLDHLSGYINESLAMTAGGDPEVVEAYRVTPSLFDALAGKPVVSRTFLPKEAQANGNGRVVVLGYALWTSRFGADPGVIQRGALGHGAGGDRDRARAAPGVGPVEAAGRLAVRDRRLRHRCV
jgi:putative ABC transport system permease protein